MRRVVLLIVSVALALLGLSVATSLASADTAPTVQLENAEPGSISPVIVSGFPTGDEVQISVKSAGVDVAAPRTAMVTGDPSVLGRLLTFTLPTDIAPGYLDVTATDVSAGSTLVATGVAAINAPILSNFSSQYLAGGLAYFSVSWGLAAPWTATLDGNLVKSGSSPVVNATLSIQLPGDLSAGAHTFTVTETNSPIVTASTTFALAAPTLVATQVGGIGTIDVTADNFGANDSIDFGYHVPGGSTETLSTGVSAPAGYALAEYPYTELPVSRPVVVTATSHVTGQTISAQLDDPYVAGPLRFSLDSFVIDPAGAHLSGWTYDPAAPLTSTRVDVYVGNVGYSTPANLPRPDVSAVGGAPNGDTGFSITVPATPGTTICAYAISADGASHAVLGCRPAPPAQQPIGRLDLARVTNGSTAEITGWAFDPSYPDVSTRVDLYFGAVGQSTMAIYRRADVQAAYGLSSWAHGFDAPVTLPLGGGTLCAYAIGATGTTNTLLGCIALHPNPPLGHLDSVMRSGGLVTVSGWAFDQGLAFISLRVDIYVGAAGTSVYTNVARPDVAAAYPSSSGTNNPQAPGFSIAVTASPGSVVCVYALDIQQVNHATLGCQTV